MDTRTKQEGTSMKKRILGVTLSMMIAMVLAACGSKEDSAADVKEAEESAKEIVFAESFSLMDDNVTNIYNGIEQAIEEYNQSQTDVHITNLHTDAQGSLSKQIADVESLVVQQPDVMLIHAADSDGIAAAAQQAKESGVKVVDIMGIPSGIDVYYNGYSEYDAGVLICEWLERYFEANPEEVLHAAILNGSQANTAQIARLQAIKEYAEKNPDKVEILVDYYGDWTTDDAMNVTEDWLQAYDNLNAVFAASDQVALGVCNVIDSNGLTGNFIVTGFDGTESGLSLIQDGKMLMTVAMDMEKYSSNLVSLFVEMALDNYDSDTYDGTGVLIAVDKTNLDEFKNK